MMKLHFFTALIFSESNALENENQWILECIYFCTKAWNLQHTALDIAENTLQQHHGNCFILISTWPHSDAFTRPHMHIAFFF